MKTNFNLSAIITRVCVAVMSLLGYSCNFEGNEPLMYGTPTGTWEIKGNVTDEANEPVTDATIKITYPTVNSSLYTIGEAKTDKEGFYVSTGSEPAGVLKVVCIPNDKALKADSTIVKLEYSGGDKNNSWDVGSVSATVDFKLKKKEP